VEEYMFSYGSEKGWLVKIPAAGIWKVAMEL
jgi:hypothetical protein